VWNGQAHNLLHWMERCLLMRMSDEDYLLDAYGEDDDADCQALLGINTMMMMISLPILVLFFLFGGKRNPSIFDQRLNVRGNLICRNSLLLNFSFLTLSILRL
jgi:hypothetical protein